MFNNFGFTELLLLVVPLIVLVALILRKGDREQAVNFTSQPYVPRQEGMTQVSGPDFRTKTAEEKFCQEFGSIIRAKAEICPKCGVRQAVGSASGRNRVGAALFALLLGGIGIHKFYLGKIGQGILYLLFCWTFIPLAISLIEGIVYLTMSDEDFAAKYG